MRTWNYHYTISSENSPQAFKDACLLVEEELWQFEKKKLAIDIDGSTVQMYKVGNSTVVVVDDYDIGAVFVNSDIKITNLSTKAPRVYNKALQTVG